MSILTMKFNALTLIAAITASLAATASAGLGWPVWAMFIGWVAFFTGAHSLKGAVFSYLCAAIGIALGNLAGLAVEGLFPFIDYFAFGAVVFVVATVVVSLRAAAPVNNVPAYFLGLIAFFAAHLAPGITAFLDLAAVSALGTIAAVIVHTLQKRLSRA